MFARFPKPPKPVSPLEVLDVIIKGHSGSLPDNQQRVFDLVQHAVNAPDEFEFKGNSYEKKIRHTATGRTLWVTCAVTQKSLTLIAGSYVFELDASKPSSFVEYISTTVDSLLDMHEKSCQDKIWPLPSSFKGAKETGKAIKKGKK